MAIPSSGAVSFGDIAGEMGISAANTLSYLSQYAGNTTGVLPQFLTSAPYGMGEFRGFNFQSVSFSPVYYQESTCGFQSTYYVGSNGLYYYSPSTSNPINGVFLYQYSYFDSWEWVYIYNVYYFSNGSQMFWGSESSGCAPY